MMTLLASAFASFRLPLIVGAASALMAGGVWLVWSIRTDIRRAAEVDAAVELNVKGASDADKVIKGEHDVHACRRAGGVWNLAKARCDE